MPKKIGNVDRQVLVNAPLPPATKTYTVISHSYAINTILKALEDNGFEVQSEEYKCTTDAKVAHGTFVINYQGDEDLGLTYSFSNSYDKSMRFRSAIGAHIYENGAVMVSNIDSWKRKHTGTADNETEELINEHIQNAQDYFSQLQADKNSMRDITIDRSEFGSIIGELYINGYLAIDQLSMVGKEYDNPSYNYCDGNTNLWTCYKHIANVLRHSHPSKWLQNQVAVHLFFVTKYNLGMFDDEETTAEIPTDSTGSNQEPIEGSGEPIIPGIHDGVEELPTLPGFETSSTEETVEEVEEVVDPNQMSLEDQIAEANEAQDINPDVIAAEDLDAQEDQDFKDLMEAGVIKEVKPAGPNVIINTVPVNPEADEISPENLEAAAEKMDEITAEERQAAHAEQYANAQDGLEDSPFLEVPTKEVPVGTTVVGVPEGAIEQEPVAHVETDEQYQERVASIEGEPEEELNPDELLYFSQEDYPDKQIGDMIQIEDAYYDIIGVDQTDDQDYWVCKEIPVETDEDGFTIPVSEVTETTETIEEPVVENPIADAPGAPGLPPDVDLPSIAPPEAAPTITPDVVITEEDMQTIPLTETAPVVVDDIEAGVKTEPENIPNDLSEDNSPIKKTIAAEIDELYGEPHEFTYELIDNVYEIKLSTGEALTLSAAYIESIS